MERTDLHTPAEAVGSFKNHDNARDVDRLQQTSESQLRKLDPCDQFLEFR